MVCSETHFLDHLLPVYLSLPPQHRGDIWTSSSPVSEPVAARLTDLGLGVRGGSPPRGTRRVMVASAGDMDRARGCGAQVALFEHGCGMSWKGVKGTAGSSFVGSTYRQGVSLIVVPNARAAAKQHKATPKIRIVDLGTTPKLDPWVGHPRPGGRPVVAISFHWDSAVCPETKSAMRHYQGQMAALALRRDYTVIGHAHPRIAGLMKMLCENHGIEFVPRFDDVLARAHVYACDVSSTMYEAAAAGLQVVALNQPGYRRNINHGLRFWELVPGLQCDHPGDLGDTLAQAITAPPEAEWARRRAVAHVYPRLGPDGSQRAADALVEWAGSPGSPSGVARATRPEWTVPGPDGPETLLTEWEARQRARYLGVGYQPSV